MDRSSIRDIQATITNHLTGIADIVKEHHGVVIKVGSARFGMNNATIKLEISDISENGEAITKEAEDFKLHCRAWGLAPADLGKTFKSPYADETYTIIGAKPRSRKFPILGKGTNGKIYKFSHIMIKTALNNVL